MSNLTGLDVKEFSRRYSTFKVMVWVLSFLGSSAENTLGGYSESASEARANSGRSRRDEFIGCARF